MKYILPLILLLSNLACVLQTAPMAQNAPVATQKPPPSAPAVAKSPPAVKITGDVYIRNFDGKVVGSLKAGQIVHAWCGLDVCWLADETTIFRGCTDRAEGRGCQSR